MRVSCSGPSVVAAGVVHRPCSTGALVVAAVTVGVLTGLSLAAAFGVWLLWFAPDLNPRFIKGVS